MQSLTGKCETFLEKECAPYGKVFMTPSCTSALELASLMILEPGDEVILPSYAFPSCANAIILRGAVPVFVDVDREHLISTLDIASAITEKTKAIMVLHYAGAVCEMPPILELAERFGLYVIEDAAQAIGNWEVFGDFGALSFHYTKNIECGQGGALIVNNAQFIDKAEMTLQCGTDKARMYRGEQNFYSWLDVGTQQIMSEHLAKRLYDQLEQLNEITAQRQLIWNMYHDACTGVPLKAEREGNGHFFWFYKTDKWDYMQRMIQGGIKISSHYEALHNTVPGKKYGRVGGSIVQSLMAEKFLVKLDTSVSKEDALVNSEVLWQSNIDASLHIH